MSTAHLLINLAILKVNWDEDNHPLDNFMPLVGYAIKRLEQDVVTADELKRHIIEVAKFSMPTGALEVLIRRASRPKYGYVVRDNKNYRRVKEALKNVTFEEDHDNANKSFSNLKLSFHAFCTDNFPLVDSDSDHAASSAFFDLLYSVAPHVIGSAKTFAEAEGETVTTSPSMKYKAARFISHLIETDDNQIDVVEDFFRGAVLAESFYYTSPDSVAKKLRDVSVYYDTELLSRILGYTNSELNEASMELHQLVVASGAKPRVYEHTLEELTGIFDAASRQRKRGTLKAQKPGDIFDAFTSRGFQLSDIELETKRLPGSLKSNGISVRQKPRHEVELGIDEVVLGQSIRQHVNHVSDVALEKDIDSIAATYRLRRGKTKDYIESCDAIFVTTNTALVRASNAYFKTNGDRSNAPICIGDHVLCMLLWLKTGDKKGQISKELLVANCVAALQPTNSLWEKYLAEVERLKDRGDITETDYNLLAHSVEAREALMATTAGNEEAFVVGSVTDVLGAAKTAITADAQAEIDKKNETIFNQTAQIALARAAAQDAEGLAESNLSIAEQRLSKYVYIILSVILLMFVGALYFASEKSSGITFFTESKPLKEWISVGLLIHLTWIAFATLGVGNLCFGWQIGSPLRKIAQRIAKRVIRGS